MPTPNDQLRAVLEAASTLLAAREDDMLTTQEWDDLQHAVSEATEPPPSERSETFLVESGCLVRSVVPTKGEPYAHRCPREKFEMVAAAAEELGGQGFSLEELRAAANVPWTQTAVALAFLKERGCVVSQDGRRHTAGSVCLFEDAMTEYHALHEAKKDS